MSLDWTTTHEAPDIRLDNVSLSYGGRMVLTDVTALLPRGKITVILGCSGVGKSTLLKGVLGLLPPVKGRILLGEADLYSLEQAKIRGIRKRMGVLFQDGALLGSLPLCENIALPLREHTSLDEDLIETVVRLKLSLVGLDQFMDYFPNQLSGGMRKRGGLARALALDPRVLLCDEPTSGLDPITAAGLDQLLLELQDAFGMTVIVVSHDMLSTYVIADHVIVLDKGVAVFQGPPDLLRESQDPFLKQFMDRKADQQRHVTDLLE